MSDDDLTIYCGNLSEEVSEEILYELFLQAGPVEDVRIPTTNGKNKCYGFVTYKHKASIDYAIGIFQDVSLYGKQLMLRKRSTPNNITRYRNGRSSSDNSNRTNYPTETPREDLRGTIGSARKHAGRPYDEEMTASLRGGGGGGGGIRHDPAMAPSSRAPVKHSDEIPPLSSVAYQEPPYRSFGYPPLGLSYHFFPGGGSSFEPPAEQWNSRYYPSHHSSYRSRSPREERPPPNSVSDDYRIVTARNHSHRHKQHHRSRSPHHKSHKTHKHRRN